MPIGDVIARPAQHLAAKPDFALGNAVVQPSLLSIRVDDRAAKLEPRVMMLLVAMAEADGQPLTRDALIERCWEGRIVTDDAIGRAIAKVRAAANEIGDPFRIETLAKLGYRLVVETGEQPSAEIFKTAPAARISRRLFAGLATTVGVAALAVPVWRMSRPDPALQWIEEAGVALKQGLPEANAQALTLLQRAVAARPGDALAWGRLALAWRGVAEFGSAAETAPAIVKAEAAARRALVIDPRQPEGLAALVTLTPAFGDWGPTEQRIRGVLAVDPSNFYANAALAKLLMSTGQVRASEAINRQLVEREPLSPDRQFRQIYLLWSLNRLSEMDVIAERALQLWPLHPGVWFARLWTLLYTGRAPVALAMLAKPSEMPPIPPQALSLFRQSISAIAGTGDRRAAIAANFIAAHRGPQLATAAVMALSKLGAIDEAYAIAGGHLLSRGPVSVESRHNPAQPAIPDLFNRMTMFLFTPPMAAFRSDRRFGQLCIDIGLTAYWQATGVTPDFKVG